MPRHYAPRTPLEVVPNSRRRVEELRAKKVLVGAAEVVDWAGRMKGKGIRAKAAAMEWPKLMRFKRSFTGPVPKKRAAGFARAASASGT